jgi:hypothetical protein
MRRLLLLRAEPVRAERALRVLRVLRADPVRVEPVEPDALVVATAARAGDGSAA